MIGIIAALDEEVLALKDKLSYIEEYKISGQSFILGKIDDYDIVLAKSGVGKVCAAICVTLMNDYFDLEYIINIGSCGALKEEIEIRSVVVANKVAFYDVNVPDWEMSFDSPNISFPTDEKMFKHALKISENKAFLGPMVSGDSFIYLKEEVDRIKSFFPEALAVEMEAGSIAKSCNILNIPSLIIRGVSDNTTRDDSHLDFEVYLKEAALNSANFTVDFIKTFNNCGDEHD